MLFNVCTKSMYKICTDIKQWMTIQPTLRHVVSAWNKVLDRLSNQLSLPETTSICFSYVSIM